jgi:hypothetical protein
MLLNVLVLYIIIRVGYLYTYIVIVVSSQDISPVNTRLFKTVDPQTNVATYEIRLASVQTGKGEVPGFEEIKLLGSHQFSPKNGPDFVTVNVTRGDYSALLELVVKHLEKAEVSIFFNFVSIFLYLGIGLTERFTLKTKSP